MKRKILVLVLEVRVLESIVSRGTWNWLGGKFWRGAGGI